MSTLELLFGVRHTFLQKNFAVLAVAYHSPTHPLIFCPPFYFFQAREWKEDRLAHHQVKGTAFDMLPKARIGHGLVLSLLAKIQRAMHSVLCALSPCHKATSEHQVTFQNLH